MLTVDLGQNSAEQPMVRRRVPPRMEEHSLLEIVFQGQILRYKDRLAIFLDHMEIVSWVYTTLEQNTGRKLSACLGLYIVWNH